jgi:hypothetical protein
MNRLEKKNRDTLLKEYHGPLNALLYENPQGLILPDISLKLKLPPQKGELLLSEAELQGLVRSEIMDEGALCYFSNSKSKPERSFREELQRQVSRPKKDKKPWVLALAILLAYPLYLFLFGGAPQVTMPTSEGRIQEQVDAHMGGWQIKQWQSELDELVRRDSALHELAKKAECEQHWSIKDQCYIGGRLMAQLDFQQEVTQMQLRITELQQMIAKARGE